MTAMMHDYRLMNPHRGFVCLNELDFGAPLKPPMASIFRQKVPNPNTFRTMILESKRYGALEALKEGILDGLGGIEEALTFAKEMSLVDRARSGVYGRLKTEMWGDTVWNLDNFKETEQKEAKHTADDQKRSDEEKRMVDEWERGTTGHTRSKL